MDMLNQARQTAHVLGARMIAWCGKERHNQQNEGGSSSVGAVVSLSLFINELKRNEQGFVYAPIGSPAPP